MSAINEEVTLTDLNELLSIFEKKSYDAVSCEEGALVEKITTKCENLFRKDYTLFELDNTNGVCSPRYPGKMFIPEFERNYMASTLTATNVNVCNQNTTNLTTDNTPAGPNPSTSTSRTSHGVHAFVTFAEQPLQENQQPTTTQNHVPFSNIPVTNTTTSTIYEDQYDITKIRELIEMAKYARCRQRFAVPVIMYRGKYICRAATISLNLETYGRRVAHYAYDYLTGAANDGRGNPHIDDENNANNANTAINANIANNPDNEDVLMNNDAYEINFTYDEVIKSDVELLNALNVTTIVDLMVEMRKIKYFMAVTSSEKADPENRYKDFNILSLPYPGCEFFKNFRDNNYMANNLHYDWNQSFNDAGISIPRLCSATDLNINWDDYKSWDLVQITQNYLKACLKCIQEENAGMLIHCISGWDRTPLFISLVRICLWADGLIHKTLCAQQMVYLTLAYDWYLFGHQLPDRLRRGEDIMFFCFHVLKYLVDDEFSVVHQRKRTKSSSSGSSSVIIIKSDCDDEAMKEDFLAYDQDSNESFSNSFICDMSITDNSNPPPSETTSCHGTASMVSGNMLTNRSPSSKRIKTSPITVPGASATRQRQESTSSSGSWQLVSETGSLDSTQNTSFVTPSYLNTAALCGKDSTPSTTTVHRQCRLNAIRSTFISAYGQTVGLKFKEGPVLTLNKFINERSKKQTLHNLSSCNASATADQASATKFSITAAVMDKFVAFANVPFYNSKV